VARVLTGSGVDAVPVAAFVELARYEPRTRPRARPAIAYSEPDVTVTTPVPSASSAPAIGGPAKLFRIVWPATIRPFAHSSRSGSTIAGTSDVSAVSASVSPTPSSSAARYTHGNMRTCGSRSKMRRYNHRYTAT
jgi:hypothetical protein